MLSRLGFFCTLVIIVLCLTAAGAQVDQAEGDFVLLQARSVAGDGAYSNSLELIVDGRFATDARPWNQDQCVFWEDEEAHFTLDLGTEFLIVDILVQVDDDDIYTIEYSIDGLNFTEVPLNGVGGELYNAAIPGQDYISLVQYYVRAEDGLGQVSFDPPGAPEELFSFLVTPTIELFAARRLP